MLTRFFRRDGIVCYSVSAWLPITRLFSLTWPLSCPFSAWGCQRVVTLEGYIYIIIVGLYPPSSMTSKLWLLLKVTRTNCVWSVYYVFFYRFRWYHNQQRRRGLSGCGRYTVPGLLSFCSIVEQEMDPISHVASSLKQLSFIAVFSRV